MAFLSKDILRSVIFQILMAMLLIAGMALASMSLSVYVTMDAQDDAEAINLAGSLRMQSYRIGNVLSRARDGAIDQPAEALALEREEFSDKLYISTIGDLVKASGNAPLNRSYEKVAKNWREEMEPLLAAAENGDISWPEAEQQYNHKVSAYVEDIDNMVTHLQRNTEGKIELLGMTEGVSIFLIIFTLVFFVMKADSNFVAPLRGLVRAAQRVERGDLDHRIDYRGDNELGLLSQTFNSMTASLQAQYRTLEEQVEQRTAQLHQSNQALYFLYKTSREIASSPYDQQLLAVFLRDLKAVAGVDIINLCVNAEPNYVDYEIISTLESGGEQCIGDCSKCLLAPGHAGNDDTAHLTLPLHNRDDVYGFLYARSEGEEALDTWQIQLLNTVAETLSTSFAFHHSLGQERRVILLEERSTIARELHDSLAQSLSYMKMETARVSKMIERGFESSRVEEALNDLQVGINAAYKHLRELLVTFRVKLDAPSLHSALEHAVLEYDEQSTARVTLEYRLGGYSLGPNEDIHVLHILREALNNAVKHSQAEHIVLSCSRDAAGEVIFRVDDDASVYRRPRRSNITTDCTPCASAPVSLPAY